MLVDLSGCVIVIVTVSVLREPFFTLVTSRCWKQILHLDRFFIGNVSSSPPETAFLASASLSFAPFDPHLADEMTSLFVPRRL